jgi:hypothetical protein
MNILLRFLLATVSGYGWPWVFRQVPPQSIPASFHLCVGGFTYECSKESNNWIAEFKGAGIA